MSTVNIARAVENIRANTTAYSPLIEVIVNAIDAIEIKREPHGRVLVRVLRSPQANTDREALADIQGFEVEDNGVGFNQQQRDSFDTLFSDLKVDLGIDPGAKGFGRFICLKYFRDVRVDSVFAHPEGMKRRKFSMGKKKDIIVNEEVLPASEGSTGTLLTLDGLKNAKAFDKRLTTIARNLIERLLPFFIARDYNCPRIVLSEFDGDGEICLNEYLRDGSSADIQEVVVKDPHFALKGTSGPESFEVRVFRFYRPRNQKSRIGLVAHRREVTAASLHEYVPEFADEFFERGTDGQFRADRNYIIKIYVFGAYLDRNVSLERGSFEFQAKADLLLSASAKEI